MFFMVWFWIIRPKLSNLCPIYNTCVMNFSNPKIGKALLTLVYLITFVVVAFVSVSLFVQARSISDAAAETAMGGTPASDPGYYQLPDIPDTLTFCGEPVPLEDFDVRESLESELLKIMYWHSSTIIYLKRAGRYFPPMRKLLRANGVPEDFLYLCVCESGMDNAVSPAKAVGFWQLLESTGREGGLEVNSEVDERYDFEKSTVVACKYLKQAYAKFGSWTLAAAAYNCGQNGMQKVVNQQGQNSYYDLRHNQETARYVYRILAFKILMQSPEKFGFMLHKRDLYPEIDTRTIQVDTAITDMYAFAKSQALNYKMLKQLNPWLRDTKLTNKSGKTYNIKVLRDGERTRAGLYKK